MMHSRETLIAALREAAEIEHGITCQYLFAAFSLKSHPDEGGVDWLLLETIRGWKADLLSIARQEMMHHGLVCNLLLAIGGAPHFGRAAFPCPVRCCAPYSTLELLPFSEEVLKRFIAYERRASPVGEAGALRCSSRTIDTLYEEIQEGLVAVDRTSPRLFIGPTENQITNEELHIRPRQFDVELSRVSSLNSALAIIQRIREHGHEERLEFIRRELAELAHANPAFAPSRPVVTNPSVHASGDANGARTPIRHPETRAAAELFNAAYEAMVLMLARLYGRTHETPVEADVLVRTAFFPLMTAVIRPLGELLTLMPISVEDSSSAAGACFEFPFALPLPPNRRSAWILLHERLSSLARTAALLRDSWRDARQPWVARVLPRFELLCENLERIADNFARHMNLEREYWMQMLKGMS
jgi:hypothetical protein